MIAFVPLALERPQTILMALSFATMLVFVGVAVWLWLRQRARATRLPAPRSKRQASAPLSAPPVTSAPAPEAVLTPDAVQTRSHEPARASVSGLHLSLSTIDEPTEFVAPPIDEPTEFVALPHLREPDSPDLDPVGTEIIRVFHGDRIAPPASTPPSFVPEKTEFIPAPLGLRPKFDSSPPAASAAARRFETPTSVPIPQTERPTPTAVDLPEHLRLAIDAFEQLQRESPTPAHVDALAGHLDVLGSASASTLLELITPKLAREPDQHFAGSLLVLLHNKAWPAKLAFPALLAQLDEAHRRVALQLLRSWDDPRAEPLAAASLALAQHLDTRALWLDCFAERGWDPGVAAIEAALADPDPRIVAIALRLLPRCDAALRLQSKLAGLLFANEPAVRMQALETALAFGDQAAWLVCRQLARNPNFPAAAQLVGLLGTESEIIEQCRAFEAAPTAELLAGLGLSGRPIVLRACVERFEDPDPQLRQAAHDALTLAAGSAFASLTDARTWLSSQQQPRILGGTRRWAMQVTAVLRTASEPLRRLLARELRIRSRAKVHVDASLLPHAFAQQLAQVKQRVAEIDFERGFPWS